MSDFEFKPIHKFFKITISSIKYLKNTNSDIISFHVYNNTPFQITLPLGLLGYCETNATTSPINEVAYRVNNILQLLDISQSTILNEELSINNIISKAQATAIDTKTIPSHPIGIISVTPILNIDTEVTHQSIKDPSTKYKQIKTQLRTPQVLITQKTMNYN